MTIRRTLLLAFLLVGMLPTIVLALAAFDRARDALQAEIERGLAAQAEAVLSDVTRLSHERLQNAATWRRLEVMQDLQVGDVDKRLSDFLQRTAQAHGGLYRDLVAVGREGRVVAASEAALIGRAAPRPAPWQVFVLDGARIAMDLPAPQEGDAAPSSTLRTAIPSAFGGGELGELQLRLDWRRIDALLDRAATGGRQVALLDAQGRLLAGSAAVLKMLPRLRTELSPWVQDAASAVPRGAAGTAALPATASMLAGVGHASRVEGFEGFGWSLLVLMPRDEALAPVRAMAIVFAVLLAGVLGLVLLAAGHVSHRIARPIAALTAYTRRVRAGQPLPEPPPAVSGEVGELRQAYLRMVEDIGRSQQQLARASALAAVGEMSSVIAHEVRTPLGIVLSSAQIVRREPNLSDEGRELLSFIESETERLGRLVSTMLETTRPRAPDIAPTDMGRVVTHAVALLAAQAARQHVSVETRLPEAPIHADCDDEQMTQVLLNLLLNGLQILKQGGRILVTLAREGDQVLIDIADDGPGIAPDARARIFEAFYFQREGGIGLGLAVVQRIVAAHGGEVEAGASELGGALFRVRLPLKQRPVDEENVGDV